MTFKSEGAKLPPIEIKAKIDLAQEERREALDLQYRGYREAAESRRARVLWLATDLSAALGLPFEEVMTEVNRRYAERDIAWRI